MIQKRRTIPLRDIFLDTQNPRHPELDAEPSVVNELLSSFKVVSLAEDIASREMSPFENLGFIKHPKVPGKFIVVEGNRRICALKLLADPSKAPARHRKRFEELKRENGRELPVAVEGVVFDSVEASIDWKALRHEGPQDGVGMLPWNTEAKQRNAARTGRSLYADLAIKLIEYATRRKLVDESIATKLRPSTLARYLNTSAVRDVLGLAPGSDVALTQPAAHADRAIQTFLLDSVRDKPKGGVQPLVHSRSRGTERNNYALELNGRLKTPSSLRLQTTLESDSVAPQTKAKRQERRTSIVAPTFRPTFPSGHQPLAAVLSELRRIEEGFPYASAYLMRAFMELLAKAYCKRHGLGDQGKVHEVMGRAAKHLEEAHQDAGRGTLIKKELKNFRTAVASSDDLMSPESLGHGVHGGKKYSRGELKLGWDNLQQAFVRLVEGLA